MYWELTEPPPFLTFLNLKNYNIFLFSFVYKVVPTKKKDNHVTKYKTFQNVLRPDRIELQQHIGKKNNQHVLALPLNTYTRRRANATSRSMM